MEEHNVDFYIARVEVGKTEKDIFKDVKEARNPGRRKVDLGFLGQLGQPPLSQAPAASRSSRARSSGGRRSSGSSSQGDQSVPSPSPREVALEKKITKMKNKQSSFMKKVVGALKSICADKGSDLIEELEKEANMSSDDMSVDEAASEDDEEIGQQAKQHIRDEAGGPAVPPQTFYPPPEPTITGLQDMTLDNAVDAIFGYPLPAPTMIPTPNWRPISGSEGTSSGIPSTRKDKGKKKMQQVRRSTRRSRSIEENEEEGSSPEP